MVELPGDLSYKFICVTGREICKPKSDQGKPVYRDGIEMTYKQKRDFRVCRKGRGIQAYMKAVLAGPHVC